MRGDGSQRQGNAADFAQEVRAFHTTGQFDDADDLTRRLLERLAEMAADDEAPWVKVGDVCFRATRIRDEGSTVVIVAEVTETITSSTHEVELTADVSWAEGHGNPMEASFNGLSPDDQTELGLRAGLLGEPLPSQMDHNFGFTIDVADPLLELNGLMLPPSAEEAVARLLVAERLVGSGHASRLARFSLGPSYLGKRRIELEYVEPQRYTDQEPGVRRIEGVR